MTDKDTDEADRGLGADAVDEARIDKRQENEEWARKAEGSQSPAPAGADPRRLYTNPEVDEEEEPGPEPPGDMV
jgi:hypothetical protein